MKKAISSVLLVKSPKYLTIISIIILLTLMVIKATMVKAGGTVNPKDASLA